MPSGVYSARRSLLRQLTRADSACIRVGDGFEAKETNAFNETILQCRITPSFETLPELYLRRRRLDLSSLLRKAFGKVRPAIGEYFSLQNAQ